MPTDLAECHSTRFRLRCWGDFALHEADGAERRPRGRKARALIAYLAMYPDRRVSRERLTALLWGERADEQARSSLRQSLFELRELANGAGLLIVDRESVTLCSDRIETDVMRLRRLIEDDDFAGLLAALPDPDDRLFANLDGLDSGFDDWLAIERTRRHDELLALIADASEQAARAGDGRNARALHARLRAIEPEDARLSPAPYLATASPPMPVTVMPDTRAATRRGWLAGAGALALGGIALIGWRRPGLPSTEALALVESADALLYQRKPEGVQLATELLRKAVALAPDHAPASASLAAALAMSQRTAAGMAEAETLARRAVALDPELGRAHGVLGMVLGFGGSEARAAIRRAAMLSPRDPEILFWLSNVHGIEGNYPGRLDALRRAAAIDPLWHRTSGMAAVAAWELGHEAEADAYSERLRRVDRRKSFLCSYAVDCARGRYAQVVRATLAERPLLQQADAADWKLGNALLILGRVDTARLLLRLTPELWEIARGGPPSLDAFASVNLRAETDSYASHAVETGIRQLLSAGRGAEIVALHDGRQGRTGSLADPQAQTSLLLTAAANMAVAFRQVGRDRDAAEMLARMDEAIIRSRRFGAAPNWLDAAEAQHRALAGHTDEAIAALIRATDRGWHYAPMSPMPDLGDEPAFDALRGDERFEAVRKRLHLHLEEQKRAIADLSF